MGPENACIFKQECEIAVQGHPRSMILVTIDSAYATSYYSHQYNLGRSLLRFRDIAGILLRRATPPLFLNLNVTDGRLTTYDSNIRYCRILHYMHRAVKTG